VTRDKWMWMWYLAAGIALKAALMLGLLLWPAVPAPTPVPPRDVAVHCEAHPVAESAHATGEATEQVECVEVDPAPSSRA